MIRSPLLFVFDNLKCSFSVASTEAVIHFLTMN